MKKKVNPWAVCTSQVGRKDKSKYERCVRKIKKQYSIDESSLKENLFKKLADRVKKGFQTATSKLKPFAKKASDAFFKGNLDPSTGSGWAGFDATDRWTRDAIAKQKAKAQQQAQSQTNTTQQSQTNTTQQSQNQKSNPFANMKNIFGVMDTDMASRQFGGGEDPTKFFKQSGEEREKVNARRRSTKGIPDEKPEPTDAEFEVITKPKQLPKPEQPLLLPFKPKQPLLLPYTPKKGGNPGRRKKRENMNMSTELLKNKLVEGLGLGSFIKRVLKGGGKPKPKPKPEPEPDDILDRPAPKFGKVNDPDPDDILDRPAPSFGGKQRSSTELFGNKIVERFSALIEDSEAVKRSKAVETGEEPGTIVPRPKFRTGGKKFPQPTPSPTSEPSPEHPTHGGAGDPGGRKENEYEGIYTGKPNLRRFRNLKKFIDAGIENARKHLPRTRP